MELPNMKGKHPRWVEGVWKGWERGKGTEKEKAKD